MPLQEPPEETSVQTALEEVCQKCVFLKMHFVDQELGCSFLPVQPTGLFSGWKEFELSSEGQLLLLHGHS